MGFYSAAVLVKDAQRHGLRVKPIDIQVSAWECTVEHEPDGALSMRMGLGYAKDCAGRPRKRCSPRVHRMAHSVPPTIWHCAS